MNRKVKLTLIVEIDENETIDETSDWVKQCVRDMFDVISIEAEEVDGSN